MWRTHQQGASFSPNTNVHPAFGVIEKIERNRRLTWNVMQYNYGMDKIASGEKPLETTSDPLKRPPALVVRRSREEMSIAGRMRGQIRGAAPGQVRWKYPYWAAQKPPQTGQRIGPFTQGSLEKQSILNRISDSFGRLGGG